MNKSVYSLVLSDEIVQEIDRLAYEMGQSRSAMVNQVLAEMVADGRYDRMMDRWMVRMEMEEE